MTNPPKFLMLSILVLVTASAGAAQTQYRLGVAYNSSMYSNKERFEFTIGNNEKVVLDGKASVAYFTRDFGPGQTYTLSQTFGPRACSIEFGQRGTFADQDIVVSVNCGHPPLTLFKLNIVGIGAGEQFSFKDNYRRSLRIGFNATANLGGFPAGDDYDISQADGPRTCRMTNARGTVPTTPLTVMADCGTSPGPTTTPPAPQFPMVELISRSTDNKSLGSYYDSVSPVIGGKGADEGRYVAFVSYAAGLGGSTGKYRQIFWRDRKTGETRLISSSAQNGEGNGNSFAPAISADGRSVAFESYASNLVPIDTNGVRDIFVWNADRNTITAVSTGEGETETNYESYEPSISGDGSLVAFTSNATNLIPGVMGGSSTNVYLKDVRSGAIKIISIDEKTKKGGGGSNPSISEDGSTIAFHNYFPLTKEDTNTIWDIYVWRNGDPKLKRISKTAAGGDKDQGDESSSRVVAPTISGNGKYVAFATTATNMVPGDGNKLQDVFVVEIDSGRVIRASVGKDGQSGNGDSPIGQGEKIAISQDGNWVAFSTKASNLGGNILMRNVATGETRVVSAEIGLTVGPPAMSPGASYVVFGTSKQLDSRFSSSGIFAVGTGVTR
ncbi:MAG: hypothetical protein K1X36_09535 [Pyrinomonadaceae bacterium]|nr:hypothetical protein [Pyrinomonadaceae bacterium]